MDKVENSMFKILIEDKPEFTSNNFYQPVIWFLVGKSAKTFRAIRILCGLGYGEDANILVRSLFENVLYIEYISKGDSKQRNELASEYLEYNTLISLQGLDKIKKYPGDKNKYQKLVNKKNCLRFKRRFRIPL